MAYNYIDSTGVIVPDTSTIQTEVQEEFKAGLGQDLNLDPSTPQGVLITVETIARDSVVRNNANLANQINPNLSGGVFLDAICALTGLERTKATRSVVIGTLTGIVNTIIPEATRVRTINNDYFETTNATIIGPGGTVDVPFQSVEYGPIPAEIGTLTQIVDGILGWESVTNAAAAALGLNEQSDYSLKVQRTRTLALQGVSLPEAIISQVYNVEGVKSLSFYENVTAGTVSVEGVSIVEHSIYMCVDGGTDLAVAKAMLRKKSLGCNWNGSVTVNVLDEIAGELYAVKFDRPTPIPIYVRVTVHPKSPLIDATATTIAAILAYADGGIEGEDGFVVGGNVSTWELGGAINRIQPLLFVQNLETSEDGVTWSTSEIDIKINEIATILAGDITVTVV